jgi:tRNA (guanosine-2'-O-)-methyltransferase
VTRAFRSSILLVLLFSLTSCGKKHAAAPAAGRAPRIIQLTATPGVVVKQACTPSGTEQCFNARDDNCNGIIDEGCGVATGLVQFAIAWDQPNADVDLEVTDPNGELTEVGRAAKSGLVKDRDCPGKSNACRGQNMENVYLEEGDPPRGKYRVRVRLEKLGGENPPIQVMLGARVGPKTYSLELELTKVEDERVVVIEL